jgi:selT/selW/selH-like putative selenoprotein
VLELEPSGGGCFEVSVDGKEIWSKLKSGKFPEPAKILETITTGR